MCARKQVSFCSKMNVHTMKMGNNSSVIPLNWICWMSFSSILFSFSVFFVLFSLHLICLNAFNMSKQRDDNCFFLCVLQVWNTSRIYQLMYGKMHQIIHIISVGLLANCNVASSSLSMETLLYASQYDVHVHVKRVPFFVVLVCLASSWGTHTDTCMKKNEKARDRME